MKIIAIAIITVFTATSVIPVWAAAPSHAQNKKVGDVLDNAPYFAPPGLVKNNNNKPKSNLIRFVTVFGIDLAQVKTDVRAAADYFKSITDRVKNRFDADGVKIKPGKDKQFTQVKGKKLINGDPKTTYHRSENKYHSHIHQPVDPPTEPPTYVIDMTTWVEKTSYIGADGSLYVYYVPPEGSEEDYDYVLIVSDPETGEFVSAESVKTYTVYEMPDLTGMTLVSESTTPDGTVVQTYLLLLDPEDDWSDAVQRTITITDPFGSFVEAEIREMDTLSLDDLLLPQTVESSDDSE